MLILQISPMRMGSTWQFNTARELLMLGETHLVSSFLDMENGLDFIQGKENRNVVLKSHFFEMDTLLSLSEGLDLRFLISCRNIFDTIKSSRRVMPSQPDDITLSGIENSLSVIRRIHELALPYHLTYIDSLNSHDELFDETGKIARFLGLEVSSKLISETSSKLSKESVNEFISTQPELQVGFNKWNESTHWHGLHISAPSMSQAVQQGLGFLPDRTKNITNEQNLYPLTKLEYQAKNLTEIISPLTQQRDELTQQRDELTQQRDAVLNSKTWRATKPIRDLITFLKS